MREIKRNLLQDAVYWPPAGNDGFGTKLLGTAVPIKVRWEWKSVLFRDAQSREVMSEAVVYPAQPVEVEGYLALGAELTDNPKEVGKEIRQVGQTTNLRARKRLNKAWL